MKGAVLFDTGRPLRVIDGIIVPALKRGQVLVDVAYSGVCHSQVMEVRGLRGPDPYLPHLLGHEATGVVRSVGDGVTKVAAGDRVVLGWIRGDGIDAGGVTYRWNGRTINAGAVTTFNEQAVVSENRVTPLPVDMPMDVGVLFGCAIPTGAGMACNEVQITSGANVAVIGVGGVGALTLCYARTFSPAALIAVDIHDSRLQFARELGATQTINAAREDCLDRILAETGGEGVDFAIDAAGLTETIEMAFRAVRRNGGVCVFASHPKKGSTISLDPFELINGKQIRGSWGGGTQPDRDIPRYFAMSKQYGLPLDSLLTKRYRLNDINESLSDLEVGQVLRPLIEINPSLDNA